MENGTTNPSSVSHNTTAALLPSDVEILQHFSFPPSSNTLLVTTAALERTDARTHKENSRTPYPSSPAWPSDEGRETPHTNTHRHTHTHTQTDTHTHTHTHTQRTRDI